MDKEPTPILSLGELCEQLSIGKNAAYELLRSGKIKAFRIKRIWKIPQTSVNEYIQTAIKWKIPLGYNDQGENYFVICIIILKL